MTYSHDPGDFVAERFNTQLRGIEIADDVSTYSHRASQAIAIAEVIEANLDVYADMPFDGTSMMRAELEHQAGGLRAVASLYRAIERGAQRALIELEASIGDGS